MSGMQGLPWGPLRTPEGCDKIQWQTTTAQCKQACYWLKPFRKKKVQVTFPGKETGPTKVFAQGGWNIEWAEDELAYTWHRMTRSWRRSSVSGPAAGLEDAKFWGNKAMKSTSTVVLKFWCASESLGGAFLKMLGLEASQPRLPAQNLPGKVRTSPIMFSDD